MVPPSVSPTPTSSTLLSLLFIPPSQCSRCHLPIEIHSPLSSTWLCTGTLTYRNFTKGFPCPPPLSSLPGEELKGELKVRSKYLIPWFSLCRVTLGQLCPLPKGPSSSRDSPVFITLFWVLVTAPSPPLGPKMANSCALLGQGSVLTLCLPHNSVNSLCTKFWNDPNCSMPSISCWEPDRYTMLHYWSFTS